MSLADTLAQVKRKGDLRLAQTLAELGVPLFLAFADAKGSFKPRKQWQLSQPGSLSAIHEWREGDALCAVTGHVYDVIDFDPQNGGILSDFFEECTDRGIEIAVQAIASTPSGGYHVWINSLGERNSGPRGISQGVDYRGGDANGQGRGFVFIAPTEKASKLDGVVRSYTWQDVDFAGPDNGRALYECLRTWRPAGWKAPDKLSGVRVDLSADRRLTAEQLKAYVRDGIPEWDDHDSTLYRVICVMMARGAERDQIERIWYAIADATEPKFGKRPFDESDFERQWSSAQSWWRQRT
jgi:hypothetical protein